MDGPWNANIHYDTRLAACVPAAAGAVIDVGCGDGFLAARLARRVPLVVAIDIDAPVLGRARARFPDAPVTWCHGDIMTHPLETESFDAVLSNAALHHLPDARAALRRLSQLVRPGGTLAIVGFPHAGWSDWPWAVTGFISVGAANRLHGKWEHTAPQVWPPRETFRQLRQTAREVLPSSRIRHLLMGRYLLTWTRPLAGPGPGRHGAVYSPPSRSSRAVELFVPVNRVRSESGHADGDVLGTVRSRGAITHPFPGARMNSLAGLHGHLIPFRLHDQGSAQHDREFVELRALARLGPATGAAHMRDAQTALASVSPSDVLIDQLGRLASRGNPARLSDQLRHDR